MRHRGGLVAERDHSHLSRLTWSRCVTLCSGSMRSSCSSTTMCIAEADAFRACAHMHRAASEATEGNLQTDDVGWRGVCAHLQALGHESATNLHA